MVYKYAEVGARIKQICVHSKKKKTFNKVELQNYVHFQKNVKWNSDVLKLMINTDTLKKCCACGKTN